MHLNRSISFYLIFVFFLLVLNLQELSTIHFFVILCTTVMLILSKLSLWYTNSFLLLVLFCSVQVNFSLMHDWNIQNEINRLKHVIFRLVCQTYHMRVITPRPYSIFQQKKKQQQFFSWASQFISDLACSG